MTLSTLYDAGADTTFFDKKSHWEKITGSLPATLLYGNQKNNSFIVDA